MHYTLRVSFLVCTDKDSWILIIAFLRCNDTKLLGLSKISTLTYVNKPVCPTSALFRPQFTCICILGSGALWIGSICKPSARGHLNADHIKGWRPYYWYIKADFEQDDLPSVCSIIKWRRALTALDVAN